MLKEISEELLKKIEDITLVSYEDGDLEDLLTDLIYFYEAEIDDLKEYISYLEETIQDLQRHAIVSGAIW